MAHALSASIVTGKTLDSGFFVSEELLADGLNIICPEPVLEACSGITADITSEAAGFFPGPIAAGVSAATVAIQAAHEGGSVMPAIILRLAALSTNQAVWLVALTPWIWAFLIWNARPVPRRRPHRRRRRC